MDQLDDVIKEMQWWMRIKPDLPSVCGRAIEAMNKQKELLKSKQAEIERLKDELNQYHKADTFLAVHGWQWKKTTTESSTNPRDGEQE